MEHPIEGTLYIDHVGNLEFAEPRLLREERDEDGTVRRWLCFSSQAQMDGYVASARSRGVNVSCGPAERQPRFILESLPRHIEFGGPDAFRAVAKLALNFLAYSMPELARAEGVRPLKDLVLHDRPPPVGSPRHVWFIDPAESSFPFADSPLRHQVLLRVQSGSAHARVRFFSVLELAVWFCDVQAMPDCVILHEIDPLGEKPNDIVIRRLDPVADGGRTVRPAMDLPVPLPDRRRWIGLFECIRERQWNLASRSTVDKLAQARALDGWERRDVVEEALAGHLGRILSLARKMVDRLRQDSPRTEGVQMLLDCLGHMFEVDPEEPSGVSPSTRATLSLMHHALTNVITDELVRGPISSDRLQQFLQGGLGASIIVRAALEPLFDALEHHLGATRRSGMPSGKNGAAVT